MIPAVLQNPIFTDEAKAREWLEARVWPNGPSCPHCGNTDADKITGLRAKPIALASISAMNVASNSPSP